jgi:hypothetical protein
MPHPDRLQRAIDRNPRTAKGRPGVASKDLVVEAIRLHLTESPNIDKASLEAAVSAAPMLRGMRLSRKNFRAWLHELRRPPSGSSR